MAGFLPLQSDGDASNWMVLVVFAVILGIFVVMAAYVRRYKKVPPNQAMVIYGAGGYEVITGGAKFVMYGIKAVAYIALDVRTLPLAVHDIVTDVDKAGVKINIEAVAVVKVGNDEPSLRTAASSLLGKTDAEINDICRQVMEGHVRGICAGMTVEVINTRRDELQKSVQDQAARDFANMGITIVSFVINNINDSHGYIDAIGRGPLAEKIREARIREAVANREATIREAEAARDAERANSEAEAQVSVFHRDRDITEAKAQAETEKERANKEISFSLQDATRQQELVTQKVQIDIVDRQKRIELQEKEILRKEKEMIALNVIPARAEADAKVAAAEGEKGRQIKLAEASREQLRIEAEGERDKLKLLADGEKTRLVEVADGQAERIRKEGTAEADVIKLKGLAEAEAIRAKGIAEAEAMTKKAEAWKRYGQAAITQMIIEQMPEITRAATLPLQGVEKVIVLGSQGPAGLVEKTIGIAAQMPALVKGLTGLDITELVSQVADLTQLGAESNQPPARPPATP